jgi:hypothetical protein
MPLSLEQSQALKTDITITNSAEFAEDVANGNNPGIAAAYNLTVSPSFWVWRTSVPRGEYLFGTSVDGTTFTFNGNGFVGRSQGELAAWTEMFSQDDQTNPSLQKVRDAFADIFSGTGNAAANRTHLLTTSRRVVTRGERLYVTGTGSTGTPGQLGFEGALTPDDISTALAL